VHGSIFSSVGASSKYGAVHHDAGCAKVFRQRGRVAEEERVEPDPPRDRADCESGCDELKNQRGLGGFTTHDINRSQATARACALVYNWWSWCCRTANPTARIEAITSRPLLLAGSGGKSGTQRGPDDAVPHTHARQGKSPQIADRQYPSCFAACQGSYRAAQVDGPMGADAALRQRQDRPFPGLIQTTRWLASYGVTAEFRLNRACPTAVYRIRRRRCRLISQLSAAPCGMIRVDFRVDQTPFGAISVT
jgi:hypothetical protein